MSLTRDQFFEKVSDRIFYKFIDDTLYYKKFNYSIGFNRYIETSNPSGSCQSGGLYFTTLDHLFEFIGYGSLIAIIELCDDSKIYCDPLGNRFKTDIFKIIKFIPIVDFLNTPELCVKAVKQNGHALTYMKKKMTPTFDQFFGKKSNKIFYLSVIKEKKYYYNCIKGFKYKLGFNKYNDIFDAGAHYRPLTALGYSDSSGLHFTTLDHLFESMEFEYGSQIAIIKLCNDSKIGTTPENMYITNKFKIKEFIPTEDFLNTQELCMNAVKQNLLALKFVKVQTLEMCKSANIRNVYGGC
jgi:hypothetical protein